MRTPKPTQTGSGVAAMIRAISGAIAAALASAAPVMPVIDT